MHWTIVSLAGVAAHRGYLALPAVVTVAITGGFLGDQILFYVGCRYGNRVFARFPALASRIQERLKRRLAGLFDRSTQLLLMAGALFAGTALNVVRAGRRRSVCR